MAKNILSIRVLYADTDAMGIVYHANYIKWLEIGRTELMRELGIVYAELEKQGYHLPVTKLYCHYLRPARYDELLQVETTISYFRRASIRFDYEIRDEATGKTLIEAYTLHAFINNQGKIVRAPREIAETIESSISKEK